MFTSKINKISTTKTIQQKAVSSAKSLPSSPVFQLYSEELNRADIVEKEFPTSLSNGVKQLKSSESLPAFPQQKEQSTQLQMKSAPSDFGNNIVLQRAPTRARSNAIVNELDEPLEGDGLYSSKDGIRHTLSTKSSKVLKGEISSATFHEKNPAYGVLGEGKAPADKSTSVPSEDDGQPIGRLNKWFMQQPKDGLMKVAYHVAATTRGAKSAAAQIDGGWHNEDGRFGGGFHVASDIPTGAMEVDHHKNDAKKKAAEEARDAGKGILEQTEAYKEASLINPTNYLTYDVSLKGGDIVDATGALTAMVMNKPKEIERAAREDNKDGILYKSSRGSGLALVLYKNYRSILSLLNKQKATTIPDEFTKKDMGDREKMRDAKPSLKDELQDRNPTTKISEKLPTAHAKENDWERQIRISKFENKSAPSSMYNIVGAAKDEGKATL